VTTAGFSADGSRIATTSTDETVAIWDPTTGERLQVLSGHAGAVLDAGYAGSGSTLHSIAGDRTIFEWDPDGASGLARRVVDATRAPADAGTVLVSPIADSIVLADGPMHRIDTTTGDTIELDASDDPDVSWYAYSPDGRRLVAVRYDGTTRLWDTHSGRLIASRPGRGAENDGAVAFAGDGRHVLAADADGTVVELDGRTLEPTGRTVDVGVEPAGIRAAGAVFAVTSLTVDPADGTEIVFGDLDDGISSRVHVDEWGPRANFDSDGTSYALGGFDGRIKVIDVETGEVSGPNDPIHSGPVAWVAFSPDGETLASLGFDGMFILSEASTAAPRSRSRPGAPNVQASFGFDPDGRSVRIGYQDGSVIRYTTNARSWIRHACAVAGRNLTPHEWRDAFGSDPVRRTCGTASPR
jgi:WD40 repeat protein